MGLLSNTENEKVRLKIEAILTTKACPKVKSYGCSISNAVAQRAFCMPYKQHI